MHKSRVCTFAGLFCLFICPYADAQKMLIRSGVTASQVNNHPISYTTPGQSNTNCSTTGTVNGTTGAVNANTNCNSTYSPPQTTTGNWTTVDNSAWVTNIANGNNYLIQCTAHWRGSKCAYLTGGSYLAELDGTEMVVNEVQGRKEVKVKYHVIRFIPGPPRPASSWTAKPAWTADETYLWTAYKTFAATDKEYVQTFCPQNPKGVALVPQAKIRAGQGAEHAIDCANWLSAKQKAE